MAKEMGLDRAPIEFQTFYFSHVLVVPPTGHALYQPVQVHQLALPAFTLVGSHFSVLRKHI